jgi:chromosome segregation ATPase
MSDRSRTRGLHQGTANHKPDCQCPPCKGRRASVEGQIKALANSPMPLIATDATIAAIELSQNTEALRLTADLAKVQGEARVLQNALNESRKISQEREKQLAETKQKLAHFMGRTSAAEAEVKQLREVGIALQQDLSTQEGLTASALENLRLAEQGRDKALIDLRGNQREYEAGRREIQTRLEKAVDSEKKAHELLSSLTTEVDAQKAAKTLAEGRYVALQRQRAGEWLIVMAFMALAVMPAVFIAGRYFGGLK